MLAIQANATRSSLFCLSKTKISHTTWTMVVCGLRVCYALSDKVSQEPSSEWRRKLKSHVVLSGFPPCISQLPSKRCTNVSTDRPVCVVSDGGMCSPQVSQLKASMARKQRAKVMSDVSLMFSDRFTAQRVKRT